MRRSQLFIAESFFAIAVIIAKFANANDARAYCDCPVHLLPVSSIERTRTGGRQTNDATCGSSKGKQPIPAVLQRSGSGSCVKKRHSLSF